MSDLRRLALARKWVHKADEDLRGIDLLLKPEDARPGLDPAILSRLTDYATVSRYPEEDEPAVTQEDAETAVGAARQVREAVRALLPEDALEGPPR